MPRYTCDLGTILCLLLIFLNSVILYFHFGKRNRQDNGIYVHQIVGKYVFAIIVYSNICDNLLVFVVGLQLCPLCSFILLHHIGKKPIPVWKP